MKKKLLFVLGKISDRYSNLYACSRQIRRLIHH